MKKSICILAAIFLIFQNSFSQTWIRKLDGYSLWSLACDFQGNIYAGTTGSNRGIFKSTNGGDNWINMFSTGASNYLNIACDSLNNVYVANVSNGLMISTNGGQNFTNVPVSSFGGSSVNAVACGKNGYIYAGCTNGGIHRSTDYGVTFTNTGLIGLSTVEIFVDRFNSDIVYAGVSSASVGGFYRSTDAGLTFGTNLNPSAKIWEIVQNSSGELFTVVTSTGYPFYKSTNGGLNWTTIFNFSGARRGACFDLIENIYTAGNGGIYKSTDGGASFTNFNFTSSSHKIISFMNRILVAVTGSSSGGVWIYVDTTISNISHNPGNIPSEYFLNQNYPNPFNPATTISYGILKQTHVKLIIYDIIGREIETLVDNIQTAGNYKVNWYARNTESSTALSSGVYLYNLETDEFTETKAMLLIK
jgi:photosystem II stability/assembly factor-like uncharacterized protein